MPDEKKLTTEEQLAKVTEELQKAKATIKEQQEAIDSIIPPEAVYSFSTTALNKDGMGATWTIRARVGENGASFYARVENILQSLIKHGWTLAQRSPIPAATASDAPAPAPSVPPENSEDSGTAHAVLMKIETSYTGGKPQLQFECEGLEHPLRYTRGITDMMKLLAPVGKYSPEMLAVGKKYGVNYLVEWKLGDPNGEGKRYRNIVAVKPNQ